MSRAIAVAVATLAATGLLVGCGEDEKIGPKVLESFSSELNASITNKQVDGTVDGCQELTARTNLADLEIDELDANPELLFNCSVTLDRGSGASEEAYRLLVQKGGCWQADSDILPALGGNLDCTGTACSYPAPEGGTPSSSFGGCVPSSG